MDYEKKYKNALEWARQVMNGETEFSRKVVAEVFPELKESEDEQHRKWILESLYDGLRKSDEQFKGQFKAAIAWLEKQVSVDEDEIVKGIRRGVAISLMNHIDANSKGMCLSNMECADIENAIVNEDWNKVYGYMKKKLEKQGEQKPVVIIPKFRVGDEIKTANEEPLTITKIDEKGYWSEDLCICGFDEECIWDLVEQKSAFEMKTPEESLGIDSDTYNKIVDECVYGEQNPANEVEPKFHKGEWIVWKGKCYKVNYNGCGYELVDQNGLSTSLEYGTIDENAHLWTIADTKDGDVLHSIGWHNDCIFIFNGLDNWKFDEPNGDRAVATGYCCLSVSADNMEFGIQGPDCIEVNTVKPATKIQRDLLFSKIKEAGYEWNAQKKELKKIEQKTEDETTKKTLINLVEMYYGGCVDKSEKSRLLDWLKSLRPKSNQEVDEQIETIAMHLDNCGDTAMAEILRSCNLRPQNHWKPSDEQMNALREAVFEMGKSVSRCSIEEFHGIESLYNDLKKLMEE